MTLVEFIAPLKKESNKDRILAVLYYKQRYDGRDSLTADDIQRLLKNARAPGSKTVNVADVLAKSGHLVDSPGNQGTRKLWKLTDSGKTHVRGLLSLPEAEPEVEHDVGTLQLSTKSINNADCKEYVEEAIKCLQVGALRAAVVFVWAGGIRLIQDALLKEDNKSLNASLQKHDKNARNVSALDHFAYIKDSTTLQASQDLGLFDKNEKETLDEALKLRNRCGHPGNYKPGVKKVSSFVEDLVTVVFQKLG